MEAATDEAALAHRIVDAVRAGDRQAEVELVRQYRPRLVYACARLTQHPASAEDLANEALLITIQRLREEGLAEPERLGGFMYRVARNIDRSQARRFSREAAVDDQWLADFESNDPSHEMEVQRMQTTLMVRKALESLRPERYREILYRYYSVQEPKEVICDAMDLSAIHFSRVLYRAKKALRELLESSEYAGGRD